MFGRCRGGGLSVLLLIYSILFGIYCILYFLIQLQHSKNSLRVVTHYDKTNFKTYLCLSACDLKVKMFKTSSITTCCRLYSTLFLGLSGSNSTLGFNFCCCNLPQIKPPCEEALGRDGTRYGI